MTKARRTLHGLAIAAMILVPGCTCNQAARKWGGTQTITLEPGQRLLNCTFKDDDIWLLVKNDPWKKPDTISFIEKSSYSILQGKVLVIER